MPELSRRTLLGRGGAALTLAALPRLARAQDRPVVVTVTYALAYVAERLGGGDVEVVFPVPDGVDPAFWRPGIADISALQAADLIVLNGAGYATWTTRASLPRSRLVETTRGAEDRFIATETVTHSHGEGGEHSHAGTASVTWLDPGMMRMQAATLAAALTRRGLVGPDAVAERLAALTRDLDALEARGAARLAEAGTGKGAPILATHPRYQYLARAFGLEIDALEWDAGAAPTPEQMAELEARVAETGARILIWEAVPPEAARAAVRALGLSEMVFPTLASVPAEGDFLGVLEASLTELAALLAQADG